jgi:hypothetical protein
VVILKLVRTQVDITMNLNNGELQNIVSIILKMVIWENNVTLDDSRSQLVVHNVDKIEFYHL